MPKDLQIKAPDPTKGAVKAAELVSRHFLRECIRLTQRARDNKQREADKTSSQIRATLSADDRTRVLEKIKVNT